MQQGSTCLLFQASSKEVGTERGVLLWRKYGTFVDLCVGLGDWKASSSLAEFILHKPQSLHVTHEC